MVPGASSGLGRHPPALLWQVPGVGVDAAWAGAPVSASVPTQGFPEVGEEEFVSVPDAKFTKGEFQVSTPWRAPQRGNG